MIIKSLNDEFMFEDMKIKYEINFVTPSSYGCNNTDYPKDLGLEPSGIRIFVNYNYLKENKLHNNRILVDESLIDTYCPDIKTHEHRQFLADSIFSNYYKNLLDREIKNMCEYKISLQILEIKYNI